MLSHRAMAEVMDAVAAEGVEIVSAGGVPRVRVKAGSAPAPTKRRRRRRSGEPLEPKETPERRGVRVFNVVFLAYLTMLINPIAATMALHGRYDPHLFTAWLVRPRNSRATLSVFGNGKVIVAGAKHSTEAWLAVQELAYALQMRFHTSVQVNGFHVKNMVGTAWLGYRVNLAAMARENDNCCYYHPHNFPGLQYRYYEDRELHKQQNVGMGRKLALVVFEPGTVVITGAISFAQLTAVFDQCEPFLRRYAVPGSFVDKGSEPAAKKHKA